ncbi:MAG: PAN/Apple domain-containing protein, partial [Pseudomonadota bacterium]
MRPTPLRTPAVLTLVAALLAAGGALAQSPVPDRRLVAVEGVDFFGNDLRALYDVPLAACQSLCLADSACGAFTYNRANTACFLKTGVDRIDAYEGAVSARVVSVPAAMRDRAEARRAALAHLPSGVFEDAAGFAATLGMRGPAPAGQGAGEMRAAADAWRGAGDPRAAAAMMAGAAALTDQEADWRRLTRDLLDYADVAVRGRSAILRDARSAALGAYFRAETQPGQSAALLLLAEADEALGAGRRIIPTLRRAFELAPGGAVDLALDRAI